MIEKKFFLPSHVCTPACAKARTEDKRRLSQPNYLDPSRENRWREVEELA
jgi:hypothetical protein